MVQGVPIAPPQSPLSAATLRVQERRFEPHVLVFRRQRTLRLINDAKYGVNVKFDSVNMVLPAGEAHHVRELRAASFPIPATSGIHPWFNGYILPLDHDYFAFTGADGRFEIKNLPLGEWEFAIWHEKAGWLKTDRFPISRFPAGRFRFRITPGEKPLGDVRVDPADFLR